MSDYTDIGVIGAGSWGTALAITANRAGSKATLWTRNSNVMDSILSKRTNRVYLPDCFIDPDIDVTDSLEEMRDKDFLILSVPSQSIRSVAVSLSDLVESTTPIVIACKGIERGSLMLMHEVVSDIMPNNPVLVISGPNFATEIANGLPAATTIACKDKDVANRLIYAIGGKYFRPYYSEDLVAIEVGGAVKNVIAIACGIAVGRGFGENARAALITRGLAEMIRLGKAKGARKDSMMGLAGLGDLMLTCSSTQSRNFSYGLRIGELKDSDEETVARRVGLTEGIATAESVTALAGKLHISMPLCSAVNDVLAGRRHVEEAIHELLERPFSTDVERL